MIEQASKAPAEVAPLTAWTRSLASREIPADQRAMIDELRALEELKCAAEARQATLAVSFDAAHRATQAQRGVPAARQGRGIAEQIALARRESPARGRQHLGLAKALVEMPCTARAFRGGHLTEWKATVLVRETACLSREDRGLVDAEICGDPAAVEAMGDGELAARAKELAYALDPEAVVERRRRAEADRRVTCRPAPDVMTHVNALLPVRQGVAVYAALRAEADRRKAAGDPRGRNQIMADELYRRVVSPAAAGEPAVTVVLNVVVSDRVLLGLEDGAAHLDGYGPIPADLVRELALSDEVEVALRRLFAKPETGALVAMESNARCFPRGLATFLRLRDRRCRTLWCDAPIRHSDHVRPHESGGPTSGRNGQGDCVACNHAKQAMGWSARPRPGPRHTVETTTPSGHRYVSVAPPTGAAPRPHESRTELYVRHLVLAV